MLRGLMSTDQDAIRLDVNDMANCSSSAAETALRASWLSDASQPVSVQQFKQAISIICWVLGLPG